MAGKRGKCSVCGREDISLAQLPTEGNGNVAKCGSCYQWHKKGGEGIPPFLRPATDEPEEHPESQKSAVPPPVDPNVLKSISFHIPAVEQKRRCLDLPDDLWLELDNRGINNEMLVELVEMLISDKLLRRAA